MFGRTMNHWSVTYIAHRLMQMWYEKRNPNSPWLTPDMIKILDSCLVKSDIGMELGSGRSTMWFAKRTTHLTSIEHDELFFEDTMRSLKDAKVQNVDYRLCEGEANYIRSIEEQQDYSFDFALIDGKHRAKCVLAITAKLKPGALLVIDNSERYLSPPKYSCSKSHFSLSPDFNSDEWVLAREMLRNWRCIWTSNGVWDTALYIKPRE